jgi:putative lipoprotein
LNNVQSTLAFPEAGRATGSTGCNRFNGSVTIDGSFIKFGALATTRRACVPGVGNQESRYMKALSSAERFTIDGKNLLIYCRGFEKPLRFTPTNSNRSGPK